MFVRSTRGTTAQLLPRDHLQDMGGSRVHMSWRGTIPEPFLSRPARAFVAGIALLGVVALMALRVPAEPLAIDQSWSEAMQDIRTPLLTDVALVFNALGRGLGRALSLTAVAVVVFPRRRWVALLAFATTEVLTSLSSTLLKFLVGRPRPPDGLVHPVGSSFPFRSRRLRRRDMRSTRSAAHSAGTPSALVVGTRSASSPRDGVEPHLPSGPLALRRRRRIVARDRDRARRLRRCSIADPDASSAARPGRAAARSAAVTMAGHAQS